MLFFYNAMVHFSVVLHDFYLQLSQLCFEKLIGKNEQRLHFLIQDSYKNKEKINQFILHCKVLWILKYTAGKTNI